MTRAPFFKSAPRACFICQNSCSASTTFTISEKERTKKKKLINTRSTAIDCTTFKFRVSFVSLPSLRARVFLYSFSNTQVARRHQGIEGHDEGMQMIFDTLASGSLSPFWSRSIENKLPATVAPKQSAGWRDQFIHPINFPLFFSFSFVCVVVVNEIKRKFQCKGKEMSSFLYAKIKKEKKCFGLESFHLVREQK